MNQTNLAKLFIIIHILFRCNSTCLPESEINSGSKLSSFCKRGSVSTNFGSITGSGGQATVRFIPELPGYVAKILRFQKSDVEKTVTVIREINVLNCLADKSASGFVPLEDCYINTFTGDVEVQLVMRAMRFGTFTDLFNSHNQILQDVNWRMYIMTSLAETVYAINQAGVIHRDIKPENVMFLDSEFAHPLIIDFGFSTMATTSRDTVGSPGFTAPEILNILNFDPRSKKLGIAAKRPVDYDKKVDVFSLGVLFYKIWNDGSGLGLDRDGNYNAPKYTADANMNIRTLLNKMMAFDPNSRYSISQVLEHLGSSSLLI